MGHLKDGVCLRKQSLKTALQQVFREGSVHARELAPGVPGCVFASAPTLLGASELEPLFNALVKIFDPGELEAETRHLELFGTQVLRRLESEAGGTDPPPARVPAWVRASRTWWQVATDPEQSLAEWTSIGLAPRPVSTSGDG